MNVASARLKVQDRCVKIANGNDPDDEKNPSFCEKHSETLGEVIETYFELHLSNVSAKHRNNFAILIAPWLKTPPKNPCRGKKPKQRSTIGEELRNKAAKDITPRHIAPFIDRIQSNTTANMTLRHLKSLYNFANRMQIVDMRNPCDPFRMRKVIKQRRDYSPKDIQNIARYIFNPPARHVENLDGLEGKDKRLAALKLGRETSEHEQLVEFCNYLGILFLTMARPVEVKSARFDHFDLTDRLVWRKHDTKGVKLSKATYEFISRAVPIHPKVAELVRAQRSRWPDSELLFPNRSDPTRPRDNFTRALTRFRALEGVPDHFQIYDLKRISISMLISGQGIRREEVSHYIGHRSVSSTIAYDLGFVDPLRPVTEKLGEVLGITK